ncbi:MAG: InlB B-repeat-containing protein [Clostridia bacterium]|nr:InlB B-repeat-containing protein [Clostridia bacterium]
MKKKIIAIILSIATLLSIIPFANAIANTGESSQPEYVNYGAVIGNTAQFNIEKTVNFLVFENPETFDYELDWDNDENWLYFDSVDSGTDFEEDQLFVIENYYYDDETTALWYKLGAAPGYELPERMKNATWAFQNYTSEYEDEYWEEYAPNALVINDAQNYVFDSEGKLITSAEIGLYDTLTMTCESSLTGAVSYQWQILVGDEWVDVLGSKKATVEVDFSLLYSALDKDNKAQLRCVTKSGSKSVEGSSITITLDTNFDYDSYQHPTESDEPEQVQLKLKSSISSRAVKAVPAPLAEGDKCYVTVQFLFENGTQAANSYVAEVSTNNLQNITVDFPYVQGYLPYYQGEQDNQLSLSKVFTENEVYTVTYMPTMVDYRVDIYIQNVENDDYSFYDSRTYQGLTGSKVPLDTHDMEGMRELLHETPTIAADGSTHVEVYYDRIYYMTRVYLMGGYGIYSVYARYGANLQPHLTIPVRPGYLFAGWDAYTIDTDNDDVPDSGEDGKVDAVYPTVPAKNLAYVALWEENATAQVNVVFWGENPNDEGYSYLSTKELHVAPDPDNPLTYSAEYDAIYVCGFLDPHTHNSSDCGLNCDKVEQPHLDSCYKTVCGKVEHVHSTGCYTCGEVECSAHDKDCYGSNVGNKQNNRPTGAPNSAVDGQVYVYNSWFGTGRYIYISGSWYSYSGTENSGTVLEPICHTHTNACLGCGLQEHTHTEIGGDCYEINCINPDHHTHVDSCYNCGKIEHTHNNDTCKFSISEKYPSNLWTLVKSDEVIVERDGSTVLNVYFDRTKFTLTYRRNGSTDGEVFGTINKKWGALILDEFNAIGAIAGTNSWCTDYRASGSRTNYMRIMPTEDKTYYSYYEDGTERVATYYGQILGSTEYEILMEVKINRRNNTTVSAEEFAEFEGYIFNAEKSSKTGASFGGSKFYYDRALNTLEFHSGNDIVETKAVSYQQDINGIYSRQDNPPLPGNFEDGSHEFAGWYLNPECTGTRVDLATLKMPASNLALYAKWIPNYHTVRIVKQKKDDGVYGPDDSVIIEGDNKVEFLSVLHGNIVFSGNEKKTPPDPDNGLYKFLGWFYEDDGVELMWDFEHHPVVADTVIYAKWSSEVMVPYKVYFKDKETGVEIAPRIDSSSLAGHSLTIKARVGNELYEEYRSKYFPQVVSHSIPLDIENAETGVEYTFWYEEAESKKYTVHYVNANDHTRELWPSKETESNYAVVTETHVMIKDWVPDEYQKTLVLSANEDENHLYFYYSIANNEGVWFIGHYTQNVNYPTAYDTFLEKGDVDLQGKEIAATRPPDLNEDGFEFSHAIINDGTTPKTVDSLDEAKGNITASGLKIEVFYNRIKYPYKIVCLNKETNAVLREVVFNTDDELQPYGKTILLETIPGIDGFDYKSSGPCTIVKDDKDHITKNIIYAYYTEETVIIDFKVVGPTGCATINPDRLYVKYGELTTEATAKPTENYRLEGWYYDVDCTNKITTTSELEPSGNMLILKKPSSGWEPKIYYAKFVPRAADLTIKRQNAAEDSQVYVYKVKNTETGDTIYVTVKGNGQVTIKNLLLGNYTVTQQNSWSWRNNDTAQSVVHSNADGTTVTFNGNSSDKWLNGNSTVKTNKWGQTS